jgi:hypothetical protein
MILKEFTNVINGTSVVTSATAAGTTQTDAYAITGQVTTFGTVALNSGARLPAAGEVGEEFMVLNGGANALSVYPPVGGKINNAADNAALSVAVGKAAKLVRISSTQLLGVVSA